MFGLQTDLYQLTMAAGYFAAGKTGDVATFELFARRFPPHRNILVAAGLPLAIDYLTALCVVPEEIEYLRTLRQFARASAEFWEYLGGLRFTGDVDAVPEGTPFFPNEPIVRVRAPLIEAQMVETYLLSVISFQSVVATKAVRVVDAAAGRPVIEFGTRRAHSPEAGVLAGRAAYVGGCAGTSNVESGFRYGVPVYGTSAHSWVMSFDNERAAYRELQKLLGEGTVYLVDTFDTLGGVRMATELGPPMWGVRLDSGDLAALARETRRVLDAAGFADARIMVSGDLNEYKMREMMSAGVPVDAFGVGTELATSSDAPNLSAVYKMVEIESRGTRRYTLKHSAEKATMAGSKQVYRRPDYDEVTASWERRPDADPLLQPVMRAGRVLQPLPDAAAARAYCAQQLRRVAPGREVRFSPELRSLSELEMARMKE